MDTLKQHDQQLLELDTAWQVVSVDLSVENQRVSIQLEHVRGQAVCCPDCGQPRPLKDHAPERSWRHLDTMQFETVLTARVPRTDCPSCGVKTVAVPWAAPHGRFTLLFEAFAIQVLQAASSIERGRALLGLSWGRAQTIMQRAVERGLERRSLDEVKHVGMDEKSFGKGHDYISVLTDIDASRVLEVRRGRDQTAADDLWSVLTTQQRAQVQAVALDMWPAYASSAAEHVPQADRVHDRFHISKHLNEAIDQVRRREHKTLLRDHDETLMRTRSLWLYHPEHLSDEQWQRFAPLKQAQLKTARAWALREQFRWFWEYQHAGWAKRFFKQWYGWASRCRLRPMVKVAKMIKRHLDHILTWFKHRISNATAEGFNSRIQSIKSAARGFRNFNNYRTRILFFCGKLKMLPTKS